MKRPDLAALLAALLVAAPGAAPVAAQEANPLNDYPTVARADYVFVCMAVNGQSRRALEQCSCSIDHIARILPYEDYVRAETVLRTLQIGGERVGAFRNSERVKGYVAELRRAQAEADIICF
ncbi:MAG TPA: hypothetical protein VFJ13_11130 [Paracoccaceae bacterium]|nr:hypothetical protein [Paracoccaceae bacterium]